MVNNEIGSISTVILSSLIVSISFFIGAFLSIYLKLPNRLKGDIVSFSAGIFLSAVSFSILEESVKLGNIISTAIGFGLGALTFSIIRYMLQKEGKIENPKDESKNNSRKNNDRLKSNSGGKLIIVGTLADSHPETLIIGIIIGLGLQDLLPTIIVLFLGNITATIDGTKKMIESEISKREIIKRWSYVFFAVIIGGPIGYFLSINVSHSILSSISGFAAGAIISFVTEELIPDAYKKVNWHIGLSAAFGLFIGFSIFHFL
jgi:ZIP family zinc transporter